MPNSSGAIVILTNTASLEEAKTIAKALIAESLAACVNIFKNESSLYVWEGKVCEEQEFQLVIKTRESLYGEVEAAIMKLHSYDVPEIIALPVVGGGSDYLQWVRESTT